MPIVPVRAPRREGLKGYYSIGRLIPDSETVKLELTEAEYQKLLADKDILMIGDPVYSDEEQAALTQTAAEAAAAKAKDLRAQLAKADAEAAELAKAAKAAAKAAE